jgi:hypothetical protein
VRIGAICAALTLLEPLLGKLPSDIFGPTFGAS